MPKVSKKELLRRKRISNALKKYHRERKLLAELFENEFKKSKTKKNVSQKTSTLERNIIKDFEREFQRTENKKSRKRTDIFKKKRKRTKVKTFFSKKDKSKFRFTNKLKFEYKKPQKVDIENLDEIPEDFELLKPEIKEFILSEKKKGMNTVNIGYDLKLIFTDSKGKNPVEVKNTSYNTEKDFLFRSSKVIDKGISGIEDGIMKRFENYTLKADEFKLYGFEVELED